MTGTAQGSRAAPTGLRVAVALYSDLDHDGRVLREADSLVAAGHQVTIYCLSWDRTDETAFRVVAKLPDHSSAMPDGSSPFHRSAGTSRIARNLRRVGWLRRYLGNLRSWGRWVVGAAGVVDVWHVHDLPGLVAVAPFISDDAHLVYDSHEIFLESGTSARIPGPLRRVLARYERRLARRADAIITVNEAEADELGARLGAGRMLVVRNCLPRWGPPDPPEGRLRNAIGIGPDEPLVLYHGALGPHRGIEQAVAAMSGPGMASVHLALLGFGSTEGLGISLDDPRHAGRIHRLPAVAPSELLAWVTDADVDVMALQHSTLNHWLSSPNKLWESLAAGVPVVVSDFPILRRVVLDDPDGPLGAVCQPDDVASVVAAIRSILDLQATERAVLRARCLAAAHERWNWETESMRLTDLYASFDT